MYFKFHILLEIRMLNDYPAGYPLKMVSGASLQNTSDAPDIRPARYPVAFFYIWYPAGYQIALPDIRLMFS
jgi:hypothetical protein